MIKHHLSTAQALQLLLRALLMLGRPPSDGC
jgi:hypothetical protein